LIDKLITY